MKKVVSAVLAVACAAGLALPAGAQQREERGLEPGMRQQRQERNLTPEQFQERKAQVLKMLDQRAKRTAEEQACVEASKDMESMLKCLPEPPRPMGPGQRGQGGPGGPGMNRPPMGGMEGTR